MASSFILIALFSLASFAGIIETRTYPGEYWQAVGENDEVVTEVMKQLVQIESAVSNLKKITRIEAHAHASQKNSLAAHACGDDNKQNEGSFEPRPGVTGHGDDSRLKEGTSFMKSFEPRPSATGYGDDSKLKEGTSFMKSFEPRPSATGYGDDSKLKEGKSFIKSFEPRPSATGYGNDSKLKEGKSFMKSFEPRPSATGYGNDSKLQEDN